jgi:hypothetical protein
MVEHLATTERLDVQRKSRFSAQFHDDITNLTQTVTNDIIQKCQSEAKVRQERHRNLSTRRGSIYARRKNNGVTIS